MKKTMTVLAFALSACGPGDGPSPAAESWYPLQLGNRWEYRVVEAGRETTKTRVVTGQEEIGGVSTWRLESEEGAERVVAFNDYVPDIGVRRFRDDVYDIASGLLLKSSTYDPFTLRFPPFQVDTGLLETYVERKYDGSRTFVSEKSSTHQWKVVSKDEVVVVPAGTFHCMHVRRTNAKGSKVREFWMAKGVGKVKEVGDAVEELTAWHIEE